MKNWHGISAELSSYQKQLEQGWRQLSEQEIVDRIWRKDHTVWKESPHEITNRLGWLDSPRLMKSAVSDINSFINELHAEGFTQALLLGMGGSSLAPEVFSKTFESEKAGIALKVLDSTDPGAVLEKARFARSGKTIFIVSTKSGGTVETISFMKYFYRMIADSYGSAGAGDFFTAITDAGSGLESMARALKYRKIFINNPEIGGRYSALSYFGLVPAALTGVDIDKLLERADELAQKTRHGSDDSAAALGVIMGTLALLGRDKVTLKLTSGVRYFGSWIEQLIAESTGKEGKGILPVDSEPPVQTDYYGPDRLFVYIKLQNETDYDRDFGNIAAAGHPVIELALQDKYDLGSEFFRWELATVIAGYFLKINPFDQPNVEAAKVLAREQLTTYKDTGNLPKSGEGIFAGGINFIGSGSGKTAPEILRNFFLRIKRQAHGSYISIQAYLNPDDQMQRLLGKLQSLLLKKFRVAVTIGFGPRYLHSTGQLHKGDAGNGLFIQLIAQTKTDASIPDEATGAASSVSFGVLRDAQSLGDRQALIDAGRAVLRIELTDDYLSEIDNLIKHMEGV